MKIRRMKKAWLLLSIMLVFFTLQGCGEDKNALKDGTYKVNLTMEGGTGKASIASPVEVTVKDGEATATLIWSSTHYDYMIVNDKKYENEGAAGENSKFTVPIPALTCDLEVIGDTTAMSTPHEIEYTLHFKE